MVKSTREPVASVQIDRVEVISLDTDDIGEIGEVAVWLDVKRMGHGVNQLPKSDRGTDLLVALRRHGVDLAQFMGIQVKAGDSKPFQHPHRAGRRGPVDGWRWYDT